ncbi:substrate-binding domain-containing protein [Actinomadura rubrisoli]|nr:substrate-binding domain-containing protein [Actinomadura rubrisoli]
MEELEPPASRVPKARRPRRSRDQLTVAAAVALSMGLVLGGGGWALAMRGAGCEGPGQWLSVSADPAIAPAALAAADRFNGARRAAGECAAVKVVAGGSGEVAGVFRGGRGTPDVWIPDSSLWPDLVGRAKAGGAPSVASSPIVFALSQAAARRHRDELEHRSWGAFQPVGLGGPGGPEGAGGAGGAGGAASKSGVPSFRLTLTDPARTGTGMASLLALQASSGSGQGALDRFTTMLRTAKTVPYGKGVEEAFRGDEDGQDDTAVTAVSEQAVWQHNRSSRSDAPLITGVYPSAGTPYLDFPYVVATSDKDRKQVAERFLTELRSPQMVADLRRVGLRGGVGGGTGRPSVAPMAGTEPPGDFGTRRTAPRLLPVVRPGAAAGIQEMWRKLGQGLNVLALIDPSGDAGKQMPARNGAAGTRLNGMLNALSTGFNLVPDNSSFGLWTLSGNTPAQPYRRVVPIRELGVRTPDGGNQRLRLQETLQGVRALPGQRPGLYSAIRSAYTEVEQNYQSNQLNVVLVLTAGGPREPERAEFTRTMQKLKGAFNPHRPVSVIALGFGADVDPALRQVAAVTDGGDYNIENPGMVMRLFLRSDQLRVCDAPRCPN